MGCFHVGSRKAEIPAVDLIGDGWRAAVWAGYIATTKGPMSRSKMRKVTGVPERTQQEYEKEAGIIQTVNYAHDETRGSEHLTGVREFERPHAFDYYDKETKQRIICWRTPDTREAPKGYSCAAKGRTRKVNKAINAGLSYPGQASVKTVFRLFHETHKGVVKTLRRIANADLPPWEPEVAPRELYERKPGGVFCDQWRVNHVPSPSEAALCPF